MSGSAFGEHGWELFTVSRGPVRRKLMVDLVRFGVGQGFDHLSQVCLGIHPVIARADKQGVEHRAAFARFGTADEEPVFLAHCAGTGDGCRFRYDCCRSPISTRPSSK